MKENEQNKRVQGTSHKVRHPLTRDVLHPLNTMNRNSHRPFSTLWKKYRQVFHSMGKVIHAMENIFHAMETKSRTSCLGFVFCKGALPLEGTRVGAVPLLSATH
jgi:hypothetical protein